MKTKFLEQINIPKSIFKLFATLLIINTTSCYGRTCVDTKSHVTNLSGLSLSKDQKKINFTFSTAKEYNGVRTLKSALYRASSDGSNPEKISDFDETPLTSDFTDSDNLNKYTTYGISDSDVIIKGDKKLWVFNGNKKREISFDPIVSEKLKSLLSKVKKDESEYVKSNLDLFTSLSVSPDGKYALIWNYPNQYYLKDLNTLTTHELDVNKFLNSYNLDKSGRRSLIINWIPNSQNLSVEISLKPELNENLVNTNEKFNYLNKTIFSIAELDIVNYKINQLKTFREFTSEDIEFSAYNAIPESDVMEAGRYLNSVLDYQFLPIDLTDGKITYYFYSEWEDGKSGTNRVSGKRKIVSFDLESLTEKTISSFEIPYLINHIKPDNFISPNFTSYIFDEFSKGYEEIKVMDLNSNTEKTIINTDKLDKGDEIKVLSCSTSTL